jgi:hypothetical protein
METNNDTSSSTTDTTAAGAADHGNSNQSNIVAIGTYWDEWTRCVGSRYQRDQLYRLGRFDGCSKQWNDLGVAFRARLMEYSNPEGSKELIASTYYKKRTTISPTAGAIWELKEKPSWD